MSDSDEYPDESPTDPRYCRVEAEHSTPNRFTRQGMRRLGPFFLDGISPRFSTRSTLKATPRPLTRGTDGRDNGVSCPTPRPVPRGAPPRFVPGSQPSC